MEIAFSHGDVTNFASRVSPMRKRVASMGGKGDPSHVFGVRILQERQETYQDLNCIHISPAEMYS